MKTTFLFFLAIVIIVSCSEQEGSGPNQGTCEVETPQIAFKFEPGLITLKWNRVGNYVYDPKYTIEEQLDHSNSIYHQPADTFATIEGFHPGASYVIELAVREDQFKPLALNLCKGEIELQHFTVPCGPYAKVFVSQITASTAQVYWGGGPPVPKKLLTVNLRKKGTIDIITNSTDGSSIVLTGLQTQTDYQAQLVSTCTDNQTYISEWKDFKTL